MSIKLLNPRVISQIAAGEVIERPSSVVKELIENSLDAGSSEIIVEVMGGGVNLIKVMDNGDGILSGELELAFSRHATSKIGELADLESITSLGFRGEALPSIAAVADIDITTCSVSESVGSYLSLCDGIVANRKNQGRSPGTTVIIRNLFRKVPARLKFLKSLTTENSHIANVVTRYALAFSEVRFILSIEGKVVLRTSGSGQLIDSVTQIYGVEIAQNMLDISNNEVEWDSGLDETFLSINGRVSSPVISRSNRGYISFFVNRRWINSRLLAWAVEEAYHGLLMKGKHPVAIIDISLSPKELDINIHPTKTEVKFQNERVVFGAVQKAVRRALIGKAAVPKIEEITNAYQGISEMRQALWKMPLSGNKPVISPEKHQMLAAFPPVLRILGQLLRSYIVAEGPDGLYLIDQHAAHERILFEKIEKQRLAKEIETQGLLKPVTFEVNPEQDEILKTQYKNLIEFGFFMDPFGDRTYLVRAVPFVLHQKNWIEMVGELVDCLVDGDKKDWREKLAISIACHSAVRTGQTLTNDEMRELIGQLEQAVIPHTCPHGRPIMVQLTSVQLKKEFGRT
ncbi:MAG: DNA mismatch repair endonuclease MutL [Dehalococcoidales bacterium]|nr:DNA mismatch repair endonuclease MutL [Dehalococcoidales bacterium]